LLKANQVDVAMATNRSFNRHLKFENLPALSPNYRAHGATAWS
jgi:hypothetical protein